MKAVIRNLILFLFVSGLFFQSEIANAARYYSYRHPVHVKSYFKKSEKCSAIEIMYDVCYTQA